MRGFMCLWCSVRWQESQGVQPATTSIALCILAQRCTPRCPPSPCTFSEACVTCIILFRQCKAGGGCIQLQPQMNSCARLLALTTTGKLSMRGQ